MSAPAMSIILATPGSYDTIRKTMSYLRAQTVRDQLEIVIVTPSAALLALDTADMVGFDSYPVSYTHLTLPTNIEV